MIPTTELRDPKRRKCSYVPKISFSRVGSILFNQGASEMLALRKGTKVSLAHDEVLKEWYIFIDPINGYKLCLHNDNKTLWFTHQALRTLFLKSRNFDIQVTRKFKIDENPTKSGTRKLWRIGAIHGGSKP